MSLAGNVLPSVLPGYPGIQGKKAKKKLTAPNISLTLDRSEGSLLSDELDESADLDLDGIDTPSDNSNEFEWEGENRARLLTAERSSRAPPPGLSQAAQEPASLSCSWTRLHLLACFFWCRVGGRVPNCFVFPHCCFPVVVSLETGCRPATGLSPAPGKVTQTPCL